MLTPKDAREANQLLNDIEYLETAIANVQKKIWKEGGYAEDVGGLTWDGRELIGVQVPKADMLAYLISRKSKAAARLAELGVQAP